MLRLCVCDSLLRGVCLRNVCETLDMPVAYYTHITGSIVVTTETR